MKYPFRYFKTSPDIIRMVVMMYTNEIPKLRIEKNCGQCHWPGTLDVHSISSENAF
jgi:hypothetical protein